MSQGIECTPSFHQLYVRTFSAQGSIFFIYYINFVLHLYNKWPNFWCFEVFISAKCIYRIYLAYLYFILSKKRILPFSFFWDFLAILQISQNSGLFQPKKMYPNSENSTVDMDFSSQQKFFVLFLGLSSDRFQYDSVCSKGTAIFCYIK